MFASGIQSSGIHALSVSSDVTPWLRSSGLEIVLLILGAVLFSRFATFVRDRVTRKIDAGFQSSDALVRTEAAKHRHALAQVVTWVVLTIVYVLVGMEVLQRLGFAVTGLVAPAAVLGAALGFGAQRIVQDILAGFFLITERQYGFGDVVRINVTGAADSAEGTVEDVTLRITTLRDADGQVIIVPNGQIVKVTNLSKDWARAAIDVPVAASADINRVNEILHKVGEEAYRDRRLEPLLLDEPTVMGVEDLTVDQMNIRMVARTLPGKQFEVGRELRVRVAAALRREGISETA
ncbi:mechanosensitive ion channel family protein [Nocardia cyriacigeorgica]|jgi:moderate conductance mechanosensitive channel|uniref:mechanosensitive ion channel family protein n=1 Tax=Nocardia cyriacigeorgica TaxID=135487 RepID=UPI0013D3B66E|nr:mechanosensitive ion channel family protein [Nocardia cyriacigeorgica]MBF6436449.1 mechanosensitive ion channel family protein [Nocardia cyriacigeorgica]MBF6452018.1 mechanosensitive ion channel family protein [Nocardia cyriacigeorgica]MBF6478382.1 mechanosensitive ion channel family protein [Nocardia cyriacigeorgica]MBF6549187.1 mechanosensitive ion channel family protein [Nocardia cyriacigeorgica]NEW25396.1 mechanosensitive ion channel family protein [Nocardia cyriacigeorgica]